MSVSTRVVATTIFGVLIGATSISSLSSTSVEAAGVNLNLSPSEQSVATVGNIVLTFTPDTSLVDGSTITVDYPSDYTGSLTDADVDVTGTNITSSTESAFSSTGFVSTLTTTGSVSTPVTITIGGTNQLTSPASAGNYSFSIVTSQNDYASTLQYVGDANDVEVRAFVPTNLSFVIRNTADTADTNVCDMGTITTTNVGDCSYRLKVGTNADGGYIINVDTNGGLSNGVDTMNDAAVGAGGTGGTNIVAGNEFYGAKVDSGVVSSGASVTVASGFDGGATNFVQYNVASPSTLITATGPNEPGATDLTNTSLVTHNAAVAAATEPGQYLQTVTYTVNPAF